jgi:hypothetical protein
MYRFYTAPCIDPTGHKYFTGPSGIGFSRATVRKMDNSPEVGVIMLFSFSG